MSTLITLMAAFGALLACIALLVWSNPRFIALWQIVGGTLIIAAWIAAWTQGLEPYLYATTVASSLAVAALAIVGGLLLWQSRPAGITISVVAQVLQVAWISLPRLQLGATLGPTLGPRITADSLSLNIGFYGRGGVMTSAEPTFAVDVTVNLLAVLAIVALLRLRYVPRRPTSASAPTRTAVIA